MSGDVEGAFERLRKAAQDLPDVEESTSYGTPSLRVRKKFLCRVKDAETVVLMCPVEEKEMLIAAAPDIFFETDHYKSWPAVLVRIREIDAEELRHRMKRAWTLQAPKRLVSQMEGRR